MAMAKFNGNDKIQWQWQNLMAMAKFNGNDKIQWQWQNSIGKVPASSF
jgi:hypothetical protein